MKVEIYNHQSAERITDVLLSQYVDRVNLALPMTLENPANGGGVLAGLDVIEVSIVDDETIAQVHVDFMDMPGATDVITFAHGEIVVSAETARSYGESYGNSFEKELMLYIIHGLLHLSGHEDADEAEREAMDKIQFVILEKTWS